jgi:glycosyltransferase involved in cell wall biosynthesis
VEFAFGYYYFVQNSSCPAQKKKSSMKIALVHDYLAQDGGAERVLKAFHEIWPSAPIFVLFHQKGGVVGFENADIRESFLKFLPFGRTRYQWYLPWMPLATERHNLHEFDLVLSSTSAFAKGVLTRPNTLHISYCHTPTRYLWTDTHEYIAELQYNPLIKALLPRLIHKLRMWDKASVDRVDQFIANSRTVKNRIQKYYRHPSDVIYPPVDTHKFSVSTAEKKYFVTGGRLTAYKRFDLVIQVFNRLGWPLKIFGTGPKWWGDVQKMAKPNIEFLGRIDDDARGKLLAGAKAFIHPQVEDFGITPVESMAAGTPVIAFGQGGATETVVAGKTGIFFAEQSWESLLDAVLNFDESVWDRNAIQAHAKKFDVQNFKREMKEYVENKYRDFLEMQSYVAPRD